MNAIFFLKRTYALWSEDRAPRVAAALTYYLLLSMAPLLVVLVGVLGRYLGHSAVTERLYEQANAFAGPLGEEVVRQLSAAATPAGNVVSVIAGVIALLGVMRLFAELRAVFDLIWDVPPAEIPPGTLWEQAKWWIARRGRDEATSFVMVLVVGLLFVVSLLLSAALTIIASRAPSMLGMGPGVVRVLDWVILLVLVTILFAVIYRYLPRTALAWRDVLVGAAATAVLFVLGRVALGLYFGYASPGSAYGAAGSLVALLIWMNASLQLALFGAEFTYLWSHTRGSLKDQPARAAARPEVTRPEATKPSVTR